MRGRGAPVGRGRRAPASQGDLDKELDSFMKPDAVGQSHKAFLTLLTAWPAEKCRGCRDGVKVYYLE